MVLMVSLVASPRSRCGGMALMVSLGAFSRSRWGEKEQGAGCRTGISPILEAGTSYYHEG
jgi:hypothetical protein